RFSWRTSDWHAVDRLEGPAAPTAHRRHRGCDGCHPPCKAVDPSDRHHRQRPERSGNNEEVQQRFQPTLASTSALTGVCLIFLVMVSTIDDEYRPRSPG